MQYSVLMPLIQVSVPAAGVPDELTYELPEPLWAEDLVGRRVKVTLRNRPVAGVVLGCHPALRSETSPLTPLHKMERGPATRNIKTVDSILDSSPVITPQQIELAKFVASYYMAPLGEVLRLCMPPDAPRTLKRDKLIKRRRKIKEETQKQEAKSIALNPEQAEAAQQIMGEQGAFLLEGITGSGKTEVYIHAAAQTRAQGKSVLVIVPEIALTPQLAERFASQLGEAPLMLHSGLKNTERRDVFEALLKGEPRILLGARSALFAPLPNLGLIVIDEEHDPSFKQDETPRYQARDVALWRAKQEGAKIVLGSATPSLESRLGVSLGRLAHLKLTKRAVASAQLPKVELIDLRSRSQHSTTQKADRSQSEGQEMCILSGPLKEAMKETLAAGEQVLLFLNRRGYASVAICDACGEHVQCPNCSVSLTYHQQQKRYRCHQCDYSAPFSMDCPACHEGPVLRLGLGTERIEAEVQLYFPGVQTARLDRDSASNSSKMQAILGEMRSGEAKILIGTQMTAKGHDFPNLSLVGVILADIGLSMPDFRASERTFQLLTQVAGRAGRRERPGRVLIQTFNPGHPALQAVKNHQIAEFSELDAKQRKEAKQPPFVRSALIRIESVDPNACREAAIKTGEMLLAKISELGLGGQTFLLGPAPAMIEKLRAHWRWQLYLRTATVGQRAQILECLQNVRPNNTKLIVDIDPVQMM